MVQSPRSTNSSPTWRARVRTSSVSEIVPCSISKRPSGLPLFDCSARAASSCASVSRPSSISSAPSGVPSDTRPSLEQGKYRQPPRSAVQVLTESARSGLWARFSSGAEVLGPPEGAVGVLGAADTGVAVRPVEDVGAVAAAAHPALHHPIAAAVADGRVLAEPAAGIARSPDLIDPVVVGQSLGARHEVAVHLRRGLEAAVGTHQPSGTVFAPDRVTDAPVFT